MRPDATRLTGQQHSKAWMRSLRLLLMAGLALTLAERRVRAALEEQRFIPAGPNLQVAP